MNRPAQEVLCQSNGGEKKPLMVIGQDMHILNPMFFRAIEEQDSHTVATMARRQAQAGADALDLNLGPAKKTSSLLAWAVEIVLEEARLPLFIASQILAQPELLRQHRGKITINSVTADPAVLAETMQRVGEYEAGLVVLLTKPGLTPFSADDRLLLAAEVLETAERVSFPLDKLYLDPLFWPGPQGQPDLEPVLEMLSAFPLLREESVRSIAGLSGASAFLPAAKRPAYQHRLLPLLLRAGLDAVILNCNDRRLMAIASRSEETERVLPVAEALSA